MYSKVMFYLSFIVLLQISFPAIDASSLPFSYWLASPGNAYFSFVERFDIMYVSDFFRFHTTLSASELASVNIGLSN